MFNQHKIFTRCLPMGPVPSQPILLWNSSRTIVFRYGLFQLTRLIFQLSLEKNFHLE